MSDSKVEFKLPPGFSMPEGKGPGDTIDTMATLQINEGGNVCLTKLGDAPMPGYDGDSDKDKDTDTPPQQKSDFISSYMNQMGGQGGQGAAPGS